MQRPHNPRVIDIRNGECVVECPQCRLGTAADVPVGIGLPMRDRITAELLAENHRDNHRSYVMAGNNS
jgi:hypothetical protein